MSSELHEIRLVGRGGQGVVTAGDLLGSAALTEGRKAQSIPTFGPERRGALAQCTVRIGDEDILLACSTANPDVVLLLDPSVWRLLPVFMGLRPGAALVFNTTDTPEQIEAALGRVPGGRPAAGDYRLFTVDATGIAMETIGRPITNTAMMGALVGATGLLDMDSVESVLREHFNG